MIPVLVSFSILCIFAHIVHPACFTDVTAVLVHTILVDVYFFKIPENIIEAAIKAEKWAIYSKFLEAEAKRQEKQKTEKQKLKKSRSLTDLGTRYSIWGSDR